MEDADRRARAEARRLRVTVRLVPFGGLEPDPSPVTGVAAISLATRLTAESWALAGLEVPTYDRAHMPIRFVPRGST